MNKSILTLLVCITISVYGQVTGQKKDDIINSKTSKHLNIPGTRLYIIPPPGFKIPPVISGLQKGDSVAFMVVDNIGGDFYTNGATFSKETLEKRGATVFEYKELKVNNFSAKYFCAQLESTTRSIGLIFGDTSFSTMVTGKYPTGDVKTEEEIKKAIKTIYYDENLKIDPFATAVFTLNESKSKFKFRSSNMGMFFYGAGDEINENAIVMVNTVPHSDESKKSVMNLSDFFITKLNISNMDFKNISDSNVNGLSAYEVNIYGKLGDNDCVVYQLVVADASKAVIIDGIIKSDFENNLKEIEKFARTIKFK